MQNCPRCGRSLKADFSFCPACGLGLEGHSWSKDVVRVEQAVDRLERRLDSKPLVSGRQDRRLYITGLLVGGISGVNLLLAYCKELFVGWIGGELQMLLQLLFVLMAAVPAIIAYFLPRGLHRRVLAIVGIGLMVLSILYLIFNF